MDLFIEGLQGSGKSTLAARLVEMKPEMKHFREGDYSPAELAWCAYVDEARYEEIVASYPSLRAEIERNTHAEGPKRVICYTRIHTDVPGFYSDLEQGEIYNGRIAYADFCDTVLGRYRRMTEDRGIFECSLMQNTVEDMILYREMNDDAIVDFFREARGALAGADYRILYLKSDDIEGNIARIRAERVNEDGSEAWYPLMLSYFEAAPLCVHTGAKGHEGLIKHLEHRQALEMRICKEVFEDKSVILKAKGYTDNELSVLG